MRAKSLTGPVVALYALKTALVAAIFISLLVSLLTLERDDATTHSASNLLIGALTAERSALDLQDGLRGYILTGDPGSLVPYLDARAALPEQLRTLRREAQSTAQSTAVREVGVDVTAYELEVAEPALAAGPAIPIARGLGLLGLARRGNTIIDALQSRFTRFDAAVVNLRRRRRATSQAIVTRSLVIAAAGLALFLLLELGMATFLLRGLLGPMRTVARAAARLARGDLAARVPRTGAGEVALLAASFNGMAESIEAHTAELASAQEGLAHAVSVAEEASATKSNFVANMSHEIRTPLNGLVGMLTLLSETGLDDEQRRYVDIAVASSDALLMVVDDVLDIAKIEAGRLELELLDFDLREAVEGVCDLMAAAARAKHLELRAVIEEVVPRAVRGDRTRVGQVLQNLVSNAIKFTAAGEVAVEVSVAGHDAGSVQVRFAVRDSGIGIEPTRVAALFEPFTQAEAGTTRQYGGTGLGLAISRQLTELMGGAIAGESAVGQGSIFSFVVPFAPALAPLPAAPVRSSRAGGAAPALASGKRVLVAEDHDVNWMLVERLLAGRGHAAVRATDGLAVLELVAEGGFDLLLMDCQMPRLDGFETTRELRLREREAGIGDDGRLPVVAMTASALTGTRELCLDAGMDDFLAKPIRVAMLDRILSGWLGADFGSSLVDEPEPPADSAERLDAARLDELRRLFPGEEMMAVLDEMAEEVVRDLRDLTVAVDQQDQASAAAAAHRIRNAGRVIGARSLVDAVAVFDHPPRADREPVRLDSDALADVQSSWDGARAALASLSGS